MWTLYQGNCDQSDIIEMATQAHYFCADAVVRREGVGIVLDKRAAAAWRAAGEV